MGFGLFSQSRLESTLSAEEYQEYKKKQKNKRTVWIVLGIIGGLILASFIWAYVGFEKNYTSAKDIGIFKDDISNYIKDYKLKRYSGYDFVIKTSSTNRDSEIFTETTGSSARNVTQTKTYFTNDFTINSNFDSSFMYKEYGFKDGTGGQAMLQNGEVHNYITKSNWFSSKDEDLGIGTYSDYDSFYLLDAFEFIKNDISSIKVRNRTLHKVVEYRVKSSNCLALFNYFNDNYRVDIFENCSFPIKAFGTVVQNSFKLNSFAYVLQTTENAISKVSYSMEGEAVNQYPSSADCYVETNTKFKFSCEITIADYKYVPIDKI